MIGEQRHTIWDEGMAWTVPIYQRSEYNKAAQWLIGHRNEVKSTFPLPEYFISWNALGNWRSSHSFPLSRIQQVLRAKAHDVYRGAVIAQRLKRTEAIISKLSREPRMKLTQMQDIGGCRAIVRYVSHVNQLRDRFLNSRLPHILYKKNDYITNPKSTGYRGIHLVYEFQGKQAEFNGLRIEIQLRTQLQHVWATAVEMAGSFTKQSLKSSEGDPSWLRLFAIMGTVFALKEGGQPVPGTPTDSHLIEQELRQIDRDIAFMTAFHSFNFLPQFVVETSSNMHYFLLVADYGKKATEVTAFARKELIAAQDAYLGIEQSIADQPGKSVVLVSVESWRQLQRAYPSYTADASFFLDEVRAAMGMIKERKS